VEHQQQQHHHRLQQRLCKRPAAAKGGWDRCCGNSAKPRDQEGFAHAGSQGSWERCGKAGWLFVQNLPSAVGVDALKYVFANYGKVRRIHVMNARSPNLRACAFVKYLVTCEAALAMQMLSGTYEMEPGLGPITLEVDVPGVFVENLPVDVGEGMLSYVFSFYGKVQGIHMATSQCRPGCVRAFVQYSCPEEVQTATLALHQMNFDGGSAVAAVPNESRVETEVSAGTRDISEKNDKEMACAICMAASKTHAFVPCGHRCVCADCGQAIVKQTLATCPICRAVVEHVLQIFC